MIEYSLPAWAVACLAGVVTAITGCAITIGGCKLQEHERVERLSAPIAAAVLVTAETHNGAISVSGADVGECNVIATIRARATTEEEAEELAQEVEVRLVPSERAIAVKVEKPELRRNQSVSISFDITLPRHVGLDLTTHNGHIELVETAGDAVCTTHNGSITGREISGSVRLRTHNGHVGVAYSKTAPKVRDVEVVTHNGSIEFAAPPGFSAQVDVATHNGAIRTDLPLTVQGKVGKRLKGTVGEGKGMLHLETHNGSIVIR